MASVVEQVLSFCEEDEQLSSLATDHPLLLTALESVPSLSVADVLSILAAVENEQFNLVQEVERYSPLTQHTPPHCEHQMYIEDLCAHLVRSEEANFAMQQVKARQRILAFSKSTQELAAVVEDVVSPDYSQVQALRKSNDFLMAE